MTDTALMPAVEIAVRSDPGRDPDKQVNEDAAAHAETKHGYLAVVCDGMGGHAGGKEASELAIKTILEVVQSAPDATKPRDALRVAIEEANRRVWGMATAESGLRPGSTVVALLAHAEGVEVAHVGDSRIYLVHGGAISQVTRDHSMVQELVDRNIIRVEDAAKHPDANKILRALGIAKDVEVDVRAEPIAFVAGDTFVLCSDGLSDLVSAAEILQHAGSQPPAQAAGQLVDLANARGGHDNVTAMVVRLRTSAKPADAPTLVKTVQVTQAAEAAPREAGSGPHGTVIAAPASVAIAPAPFVGAKVPVAPPVEAQRASAPERRSNLPIVLGLTLAAILLILAVLSVWQQSRPHRVNPAIVDSDAAPSSASATEEPAAAPAEIAPAPALSASSPAAASAAPAASPLLGHRPGEPAVCAAAREAVAAHSSAAPHLAKQCRAQGGTL